MFAALLFLAWPLLIAGRSLQGGGSFPELILSSITISGLEVVLDNVDADAFNNDPEAQATFAESVADSMDDVEASDVQNIEASAQRRLGNLKARRSLSTAATISFDVVYTLLEEKAAATAAAEDAVAEFGSKVRDGTFEAALAATPNPTLASASVNAALSILEATPFVSKETTRAPTASPTAAATNALAVCFGSEADLTVRADMEFNDFTMTSTLEGTLTAGTLEVKASQVVIVEASVESFAINSFDLYDDPVYAANASVSMSARLVGATDYDGLPLSVPLHASNFAGTAEYYPQNPTWEMDQTNTARFIFAAPDEAEYTVEIDFHLEASALASNSYYSSANMTVGEYVVVTRALDAKISECTAEFDDDDVVVQKRRSLTGDGALTTTACYADGQKLTLDVEVDLGSVPKEVTRNASTTIGSISVTDGQSLVVELSAANMNMISFELYDDYQEYAGVTRLHVQLEVFNAKLELQTAYPKKTLLRSWSFGGEADDSTQNEKFGADGVNSAVFYVNDLDAGDYDLSLRYKLVAEAEYDILVDNFKVEQRVWADAQVTLGEHVVVVTALEASADECAAMEDQGDCASCVNSDSFTDSEGYDCDAWHGWDCKNYMTNFADDDTYTDDQIQDIRDACPRACGTCIACDFTDDNRRQRQLIASTGEFSSTTLCYAENREIYMDTTVGEYGIPYYIGENNKTDVITGVLPYGSVTVEDNQIVVLDMNVESTVQVDYYLQGNDVIYQATARVMLSARLVPTAGGDSVSGLPDSYVLNSASIDGTADDYSQNEELEHGMATGSKFIFPSVDAGDYDVDFVFTLRGLAGPEIKNVGRMQAKIWVNDYVASVSVIGGGSTSSVGYCAAEVGDEEVTVNSYAPTATPVPTATLSPTPKPTPKPTTTDKPTMWGGV